MMGILDLMAAAYCCWLMPPIGIPMGMPYC